MTEPEDNKEDDLREPSPYDDGINLSTDELKACMFAVAHGMPGVTDEDKLNAALLPAVNEMIRMKVAIMWYCGVMNKQMTILLKPSPKNKDVFTPISDKWPSDTDDEFFEPLRYFLPDDDDDY